MHRICPPFGTLALRSIWEGPVFSQRLENAARLVECRLDQLMGELTASGTPPRLIAAMRHAALGGGKRLRPFLVLECAGLFAVPASAALATAAALECVHCYSLVHDDLPAMDNDALRRGKPTVHKAFDEWTAILAGDGLLSAAFWLLAGSEAHQDPAVRSQLVCGLAAASGAAGMVGGQCLDLEADKLNRPAAPDLAHVERLQAMKTGALITFACTAGALIGGATADEQAALRCYGERLGLAFQIADDLLDREGDATRLGKATRKDAGKATILSVAGVARARQWLDALEAEMAAALATFGLRAEGLRQAAHFVVSRTA
jgi:farnesyl diphosphate synthase